MQSFQKYFSLLFFLAFSFGASAWGGFVTSIYKEPWYSTLNKPSFNPPDYIFPSIWVFLYVSMAFGVWLIWINSKKTEKNVVLHRKKAKKSLRQSSLRSFCELRSRVCATMFMLMCADSNTSCFNLPTHIRFA